MQSLLDNKTWFLDGLGYRDVLHYRVWTQDDIGDVVALEAPTVEHENCQKA